jgi:hypothetical protein
MEEGEKHVQGFGRERPQGNFHMKDQGIDGRMGSKWTLGRLVGVLWIGLTWLRIGIVCGLL